MTGRRRQLKILGLISLFLLSAGSVCASRSEPGYPAESRRSFLYGHVRVNYYEFGQGEPVIFLHGFGGAAYTWRHLAPSLQKNWRVFLMDLKGFGLSARPRDDRYSVHDQADLIKAFIAQQNLEKVTLVGHSYGGAVALLTYFKIKEPEARIKSLILLDSAVYPRSMPKFIKLLRFPVINRLLVKITPTGLAVRAVLRRAFYDDGKINPEMIDSYTYFNQLPGSDYVLRKTAEQLIPPDLDEIIRQLRQIKVPVLLIWGWDDDIIPLSYGFQLHRDIPRSRLVSLKQCGHIPPEEKPEETLAEIKKFLESLPD